MKTVSLNASLREKSGTRSVLREIRNKGFVCGVVYGGGKEPLNVSVNLNDLIKIIKESRNAIVTLKIDSKEEELVIIKEIQKDAITDKIIHVDFNRISTDKKIDLKVPIRFVGEPYGVKTQGGIAEYDMRELSIRCFPKDIPNEIAIDVSSLKIGDSLRVKDLKFEKFEIRENPENLIVSIVSTKEEEIAPTVSPTQPEVIEKGKKTEEEIGEGKKEEVKKEEPKKEEKK
jgi:large subunit ribosomal protein L25